MTTTNSYNPSSMAEIGSASKEDIQRTARVAGLRDFHTPTLEAVERRRMQLWITALLLLAAVSMVLVSVTLEFGVILPTWLRPQILQGGLVVLVLLFAGYAVEKEVQLRRLTRLLIAERVLTASLTNRLREISFLVEAGKALNLNLDLQGVLDTIRRCVVDLLRCRESSIMMVHADDRLRCVTGDSRKTIQFGEGLAGRVANSREPLLVTAELFETKRSDDTDIETPPHSVMCVPLIHREVLLGVLQVDAAREREYTQHDLRALSLFAEQAASAIANAQLYEEQRLTASRSAYQALHDTLTSLPNRVYFLDRLEQALERQQFSDEKVALLFIDVDNFKVINDSLGHFAGDEVLVELGRRMRSSLRATDTAARLGGDEFAVLEEGVHCAGDAIVTAERLHDRLSEPFFTSIQEQPIHLSVSVGIALEGPGGKIGTELLRNANTAMRNAKRSQKPGTTVVFDKSVEMGAFEKIDLESELHRALERREFELTYQPIFSLESGQIVALEALVRWRHPERGMMPASAFIGIAEQSGLIGDIDRWVFARACEAAHGLATEAYPSLDIHLNLLPSRLGDPQTANDLGDALSVSGIDPQRVVLEVSENAALTAIHKSRTTFNEFKALGIRIALDDFGTGYSSLTYLNRFPVDVIKIHRLFVSGITESLGEADLAKAIINLGMSLNISVIAQGIERKEQLSRLQQMECPFAQGIYLSEPMPFTSLDKLLQSPGTISFLHSRASTAG